MERCPIEIRNVKRRFRKEDKSNRRFRGLGERLIDRDEDRRIMHMSHGHKQDGDNKNLPTIIEGCGAERKNRLFRRKAAQI